MLIEFGRTGKLMRVLGSCALALLLLGGSACAADEAAAEKGQGSKAEVLSELFWASLHGIAELTRTRRFPPSRRKERVRTLVELFTFAGNETAQVVEAR